MSGRADFYVLPAGEERHLFACRLVEKAYKLGNKVWLRLDESALEQLDTSLWAFRPESFVPHQVFKAGASLADCPVWLMTQLPGEDSGREDSAPGNPLPINCDLVVNLATRPLAPPANVGRVVELVSQEAHILQLTRQQYARYKALNWVINTHKL